MATQLAHLDRAGEATALAGNGAEDPFGGSRRGSKLIGMPLINQAASSGSSQDGTDLFSVGSCLLGQAAHEARGFATSRDARVHSSQHVLDALFAQDGIDCWWEHAL